VVLVRARWWVHHGKGSGLMSSGAPEKRGGQAANKNGKRSKSSSRRAETLEHSYHSLSPVAFSSEVYVGW